MLPMTSVARSSAWRAAGPSGEPSNPRTVTVTLDDAVGVAAARPVLLLSCHVAPIIPRGAGVGRPVGKAAFPGRNGLPGVRRRCRAGAGAWGVVVTVVMAVLVRGVVRVVVRTLLLADPRLEAGQRDAVDAGVAVHPDRCAAASVGLR